MFMRYHRNVTDGVYPIRESMSEASERKLRRYADTMRDRTRRAMLNIAGK